MAKRRKRRVRRNQRFGALFVLLVALSVMLVGFQAEALWVAPWLTRLIGP